MTKKYITIKCEPNNSNLSVYGVFNDEESMNCSFEQLKKIKPFDGYFDIVTMGRLQCYVSDTGLIDGKPFNLGASILMARPLYGDALILASDAKYQGHTEFLSEEMTDSCVALLDDFYKSAWNTSSEDATSSVFGAWCKACDVHKMEYFKRLNALAKGFK